MVAGEHTERIAALKQPTLILWGDRDRLIPPAAGRQFQQMIAGSRLVMLEGLGHVPQEEDPARSVAPVKDFLQDPLTLISALPQHGTYAPPSAAHQARPA
jgi:pimeloyl-ACP methyl ester carboxylesterase